MAVAAASTLLAHLTNETGNSGGKLEDNYSIYRQASSFAFVFVHIKLSNRETDRERQRKREDGER